MPTVFCSIKLSKLIGVKNRIPSVSMENWNAHLFTLQRRKCLVFVHKETFYSFVIFDVLKKDLSDFQQIFTGNFIKQLENDHLLSDGLKNFITNDFQNFELSTTDGDKSTIGFLNDCVSRLTWNGSGGTATIEATRKYVQNYYNDIPVLSKKIKSPKEAMAESLKKYRQKNYSD